MDAAAKVGGTTNATPEPAEPPPAAFEKAAIATRYAGMVLEPRDGLVLGEPRVTAQGDGWVIVTVPEVPRFEKMRATTQRHWEQKDATQPSKMRRIAAE